MLFCHSGRAEWALPRGCWEPRCGGCAATAPKPVRHIASLVVTASAPHAAFEDVYSSLLRHGPEPFAKRLIMSVTNHVPAGPIESLAL